jgi:Tol biopolymer transport system component
MKMKKIFSIFVLFILFFMAVENNSFPAQKIGKIVYSTRGTGYKIWVMNEDGTNPVQLTFGPGRDAGPLWSPCGTKIYFHSNRETGGNPADYYEIFVMNNDGSNLRKLASIPGANCVGGDWYYDGSKIGFTVNFGSNNNSIYWISVDEPGSQPEPLYDVHAKVNFCSFSPDGTKMIFIQSRNLYIMNIDGTGKTIIGNAQRADWLPNTDAIVYVQHYTYRDIWTFNTTTLEKQQLTFEYPTQEFFLDPHWSWPNSQKIVYNRAGDLWIMNSDGSNKIQLTFDGLQGEGSGDLYYFEANSLPTADAGDNITITSEEVTNTVITGTALDEDPDDSLEYRWKKEEIILSDWAPAGENGECPLYLDAISIGIGTHTFTLEVTDGEDTAEDDMQLTILNSPPNTVPSGGGIFEINEEVTLGGYVSDFDGDLLNCQWLEGTNVLFSCTVQTINGGTPVELPVYTIANLSLGIHTIVLQVDDGVNEPVSGEITVEIVDTTSPTLAPVANKTLLWPPNHKMVDIVVEANVSDNSGLPVTLYASVSSNEPVNGSGDGDKSPDWTEPVIDQENGIITLQLRSERSGKGNSRVYTITITATDTSNNSTTANIEITVPHDKKKG